LIPPLRRTHASTATLQAAVHPQRIMARRVIPGCPFGRRGERPGSSGRTSVSGGGESRETSSSPAMPPPASRAFGEGAYDEGQQRAHQSQNGEVVEDNRAHGHWDHMRRELACRTGHHMLDTNIRMSRCLSPSLAHWRRAGSVTKRSASAGPSLRTYPLKPSTEEETRFGRSFAGFVRQSCCPQRIAKIIGHLVAAAWEQENLPQVRPAHRQVPHQFRSRSRSPQWHAVARERSARLSADPQIPAGAHSTR